VKDRGVLGRLRCVFIGDSGEREQTFGVVEVRNKSEAADCLGLRLPILHRGQT
jgi:hypothetical protein